MQNTEILHHDLSCCISGSRMQHYNIHLKHTILQRKDANNYLSVPDNVDETSCHIHKFVLWLWTLHNTKAKALALFILQWLGFLFNFGDWHERGDDQALNIPILKSSTKRHRRIPERFRDAVARMGAAGGSFSSAAHVLRVRKRLGVPRACEAFSNANRWHNATMAKFLCAVQRCFRLQEGGIVSLAWDATRLSDLDYMFSVMWCNRRAAMMPPIVPSRSLQPCM